MPDRLIAIVTALKSDPGIAGIVDTRVWPEEMPDNIVSRMPLPSILVMSAGGSHQVGGAMNDFSDERLDVRCYAWSTMESCRALERMTYDYLRRLTRLVVGDTLIHWCRSAGGAIPVRSMPITWPGGVVDESTHWPYVQRSWQVLAADIPVPVP